MVELLYCLIVSFLQDNRIENNDCKNCFHNLVQSYKYKTTNLFILHIYTKGRLSLLKYNLHKFNCLRIIKEIHSKLFVSSVYIWSFYYLTLVIGSNSLKIRYLTSFSMTKHQSNSIFRINMLCLYRILRYNQIFNQNYVHKVLQRVSAS